MKKLLTGLIAVMILTTCSHKASKLYIIGGPQVDAGFGMIDVSILSDPIIDSATVKINDAYIPEANATGVPIYVKFFEDMNIPIAGNQYKMDFWTDNGSGSATCVVPNDFAVSAPDSVSLNTEVNISWNRSANADWFMIQMYLNDTSFNFRDTTFSVEDTSVIIPSTWTVTDGFLDFYIEAVNGPVMKKGTAGNISGASGFWLGINSVSASTMVGHPFLAVERKKITRDQRTVLRDCLKLIAPYDEDAAEALEELK